MAFMILEKASLKELTTLKGKVEKMLEHHKNDLQNVLRYRGFEYIAPLEIEGISKYMILHDLNFEYDVPHTFFHRSTNGGEKITFVVEEKDEELPIYHVKRIYEDGREERLSIEIDYAYASRRVKYKGKLYKALPETGDTYSHIVSQQKDIEEGTAIDLKAKVISLKDKHIVEIMNLFHDIPEKGLMEVANNYAKGEAKTQDEHQLQEQKVKEVIEEAPLTDDEKQLLSAIYENQKDEYSLFKYYEYLRYFLYDNKIMETYKSSMNNHEKIFGELTVRFIHHLMKEHALPSGRKIKGIDLPSTQQLLRDNTEWLDYAFDYTKKYCRDKMNEQGRKEYPGAYDLRQEVKTML